MPGLKAMIPLDGSKLSESALSILPFLKSLGFDSLRRGFLPRFDKAYTALIEDLQQRNPQSQYLAQVQLVQFQAYRQAGDTDKAVAEYDALAKDSSVDEILRDHSTLQAATLRLDKADYSEMEQRLKTLAEGNSAWRFSARELLGLSAYRLNNMGEAEKQFSALVGDQGTPPNLRERANMMLALIVGTPQSLSTTAK